MEKHGKFRNVRMLHVSLQIQGLTPVATITKPRHDLNEIQNKDHYSDFKFLIVIVNNKFKRAAGLDLNQPSTNTSTV